MKKLRGRLSKSLYILLAFQLLVLVIAGGSYLIGRGHAFQKSYTLDEYQVADCTSVVQDVTIDANSGYKGDFLATPPLELDKGIYQIVVNYNADRAGSIVHVHSNRLNSLEFSCPSIELDPAQHSVTLILDISRHTDDIVISSSFSGEGYLSITGVNVHETSHHYKQNLFYAVILCIFFIFIYQFTQSDLKRKRIMLALAGMFLVSCYPLYTDYLVVGHDIPFHLLRIEGIKTGLSQGVFPVRIHPVWAKDYGYAVGVFYGDAFLYLPAFLRLIGFSIQTAYKYFVATMNLGTIAIAYFSFRRMFRSSNVGVVGALAYSFSLYRLADVYTRASVGEYTAIMFLPVVLLGFYLIFQETEKSNWWKHSILVALGLTGIIQSHILSCEMILIFIVLLCIILIRKVCTKYIFASLASGALLTLLMNIGFLVPFLDMYQSELYINATDWIGSSDGTIQSLGMFPLQLFSFFQENYGGSFSVETGVMGEVSFNVGVLLLIAFFLFIYLLLCHRQECMESKNYHPAILCFVFATLTLWMSSCYFPWDAIASTNDLLGKLVVSLEFPWRFLSLTTVFLTFVCCFAYQQLAKVMSANAYTIVVTFCLVLLTTNCGWYFYDYYYNGAPYRVYETYELNTMQMYSYDYLPAETDPENIVVNRIIPQNVALDSYQKMGTKILCHVVAETNGGTVDFPLNYYKYYQCRDIDTGASLNVVSGYNGMVQIVVPAGYSGTLQISFEEPFIWTLTQIISVLSTLAALLFLAWKAVRKPTE